MSSPKLHQLKEPAGKLAAAAATDLGRHIPALDGLRGIAILMVIVCHFIGYGLRTHPAKGWVLVSSVGATGVDLFFVLSGFLITRILLAARGRPDFLRNFYARRILRIFPLYYGFLIFIYVLVPLLRLGQRSPLSVQWWTWTYLQNVGMTFFPHRPANLWEWTPHFWSLAVEEHFYLVWPFIVKVADAGALPFLLLGTIPFSILSRALVMWSGHGPAYLTPCRVDALGMGSLLAVLTLHPKALDVASRWAPRALAAFLPLSAALVLFSGKALAAVQLFKDTGWAVLYGLVLLLAATARPGGVLQSALSHPALTIVGKYSYGMYVLHLVILGSLPLRRMWPPLAFLLLLATVFCAAALSFNLFEQPFLRLKDRFKY